MVFDGFAVLGSSCFKVDATQAVKGNIWFDMRYQTKCLLQS